MEASILSFVNTQLNEKVTLTLSFIPCGGAWWYILLGNNITLLYSEIIVAMEPAKLEEFGLINDVFASEELHARVMDVAKTIASKSSYVLKLGKETFYKQLNMSLEDAYEYAAERMIKNLQADDAKEGIDAFLNKRDPEWSNS